MVDALPAFLLTCLLVEITPGPNMAYLALLSLDRGRRAGFAAVAGVATGLLLLGLLAGFGVGAVVAQNRLIYEALRWSGVAYLLWLAWDTYREAQQPLEAEDTAGRSLMHFRRGVVTNLLNPKAVLFYISVLPNFLGENAASMERLTLVLAYVAVATGVHAAIVLAAGSLQPLMQQRGIRRTAGIVFGLMLVIIAAWLAISTQRSW